VSIDRGLLRAVGGVAVAGEAELRNAPTGRELRGLFHERVGIESPQSGAHDWKDPSALAELYELVRRIRWSEHGGVAIETKRVPLTIDGEREGKIVERWMPVLLGADGVGDLVWPNSD